MSVRFRMPAPGREDVRLCVRLGWNGKGLTMLGRAGWVGVMLSLVVFTMPSASGQDPPLPENTVVYIRSAPVGQLLANADTLSVMILRGTPMASLVDSGQIVEHISAYVEFPLSILDPAKCIHLLIVTDATPHQVGILLLPFEVNDASRAAIADINPDLTLYDAGAALPGAGVRYVYADIGDGYAAIVPASVEDISGAVSLAKHWARPPPLAGNDVEMILAVDHLRTLYESTMRKEIEDVLSEMVGDFQKSFGEDFVLDAALRVSAEGVFALMRQMEHVRLWGRFSQGELAFTLDLVAKPASPLAGFLNLHTASPLPLALLRILPANASIITVEGAQHAVYARLADDLAAYVLPSLIPVHAEGAARLCAAIRANHRAHGPSVSAVHAWTGGEPETAVMATNASTLVSYIRARDPEGLIDARLEMAVAGDLILNAFLTFVKRTMWKELPISFKITAEKDAAVVGELPVSRIRGRLKVKGNDGFADAFAVYQHVVEAFVNVSFAVHDGVVIVVRGGAEPGAMEEAIRALVDGTADFGADPERMEPFAERDGRVAHVLSFHPVQSMKWLFEMKMDALPFPKQVDSLRALLESMPTEFEPIVIDGQRHPNGLRVELRLPTSTVRMFAIFWSTFLSIFEDIEGEQGREQKKQRKEGQERQRAPIKPDPENISEGTWTPAANPPAGWQDRMS